MEGGGHERNRRIRPEVAPAGPMGGWGGSPGAGAVDQRGDEPAVDIPWDGDVVRPRDEGRDGLVAVELGPQVQPAVVALAAPVAVVPLIRVILLNRFRLHRHPPSL